MPFYCLYLSLRGGGGPNPTSPPGIAVIYARPQLNLCLRDKKASHRTWGGGGGGGLTGEPSSPVNHADKNRLSANHIMLPWDLVDIPREQVLNKQ